MARQRPSNLASRSARRAAIEALLTTDPDLSNASVARSSASDGKTVAKVRAELEREGAIRPRTRTLVPQRHGGSLLGAEAANDRATRHGCDSDARLAPLRVEGERFARDRWPWLDPARTALVADLSARVELARRWVEARGLIRNRVGDVFPVVDRLERWSARLEGLIVRLDAEARERERVDPAHELDAVVAEIVQSRGNGGGGDG
jgi:hypothetical protein